MIISVETATRANDYDWYAESGRLCTTRPRTVISENTASFAFYAERINGVWSATMFNLWLPEKKDENGRRIRLSVRFDELESEAQIRALALAYLALPLEKISSIKSARYSAELAECYGVAEDDTPLLQFDKIKQWAESAIARAALAIPGTPASSACYAEVDKSSMTELEEIRRHLQTYALRDQDGMRLLFDEAYVEGLENDVDVIITTGDTGTRMKLTPFIQETARKGDERGAPYKFAVDKLEQLKNSDLTKKIKDHDLSKKFNAGCAIFGIVLVAVVLCSIIVFCNQAETTYATLELKISNLSMHLKMQGKDYTISAPRKIELKPTPNGKVELEITDIPSGSSVTLNGTEIGTGPGTYTIPATGGTLQILPPKS